MHLSLSIPINMCGILFNILSVFFCRSRFSSPSLSLLVLFFVCMCKCVRCACLCEFPYVFGCLCACANVSCSTQYLMFSLALICRWWERCYKCVTRTVFMHCIHIDRIFLHKLFLYETNRFSLSRPFHPSFFSPDFVAVPFDERYARTIRIFPLILWLSLSLSCFCFQKASNSMSLLLYYSLHIHMFIPPTVGYTQNRMMRKAQVKRCTIVFILFICCRRFGVSVLLFLLAFDYFYLTWFCCNTSSFFIAAIGCCFSSNERRAKKANSKQQQQQQKKT